MTTLASSIPTSGRLGKTGWSVSPLGFGSYRISADAPESGAHRAALRLALTRDTNRTNLIDTSTNYGDGASERLIGEILEELNQEGRIRREELFVVSKVGYVQNSNLELARSRAKQGKPYPDMVEFSDQCWHCISPSFIEEQLTASLERLKLKQLDALLLHNPEYYLKAGGEHAEYYRRIEAAFVHLEREVERGRIRWYGISSNTFPEPREAPDYTSLEMVTEIAEKQGPHHHFALIQFPFNLYEPGAALEVNNGAETVLQYARAKDLGTLINRPLNAFSGQEMIRLAEFPAHDGVDVVGQFKEAMDRATVLEASYPGRNLLPAQNIAWGHILRQHAAKLADLDSWKNFQAYRIAPRLENALERLEEHAEFRSWAAQYRKASTRLFETYTAYLESQASFRSDKIAGLLDHLCPELHTSQTLSQKAIRLYRSIPGLDCILLGMRQTQYVLDATLALNELQPPIAPEVARCALLELSRKE